MNNKKTLLISILITAAAIGLIETGIIEFKKESIHAQQEFRNLVLEKDGEKITIPAGDWVVAVDALKPDIYIGGELLGVSADGIMIREQKNSWERNIPANDIGILYHGEYKVSGKFVKQGMKVGGLISLGLGTIAGIAIMNETRDPSAGLGCGLLGGLAAGTYLVPGGALIGFIRAKVVEGKAVEYIMGPNDWKIVLE